MDHGSRCAWNVTQPHSKPYTLVVTRSMDGRRRKLQAWHGPIVGLGRHRRTAGVEHDALDVTVWRGGRLPPDACDTLLPTHEGHVCMLPCLMLRPRHVRSAEELTTGELRSAQVCEIASVEHGLAMRNTPRSCSHPICCLADHCRSAM